MEKANANSRRFARSITTLISCTFKIKIFSLWREKILIKIIGSIKARRAGTVFEGVDKDEKMPFAKIDGHFQESEIHKIYLHYRYQVIKCIPLCEKIRFVT